MTGMPAPGPGTRHRPRLRGSRCREYAAGRARKRTRRAAEKIEVLGQDAVARVRKIIEALAARATAWIRASLVMGMIPVLCSGQIAPGEASAPAA